MVAVNWAAQIWVSGFVLRSPDLRGLSLPDVERVCGFHRGRLDAGGAVYRLHWRVIRRFLESPSASVTDLGLFPVGYNDERGARDWSRMFERAAVGDVRYNGYSVEQVKANKAFYSPKGKPFDSSNRDAAALLEAEMASLYMNAGFVGKVMPVKRHCSNASVEAFEQYPSGAGIREYELVKRQPFDLLTCFSGRDYSAGRTLNWR